jgi:hypothetical protein
MSDLWSRIKHWLKGDDIFDVCYEERMRRSKEDFERQRVLHQHAAEIKAQEIHTERRDRFAGYALTGLLAAGDHHAYNRDEAAAEAWKQADAMLKARGQ